MISDESEKSPALAGLSQAERLLIDTLVRQGQFILRATDLEQMAGLSIKNPNLTLSRLYKKGWLQRLKSGVYRLLPLGSDSVDPIPEDPWLVATELFSPCYIGGWTATEHWDLTEQIYNTTLVFSAQKQRATKQKIAGLDFKIRFLPEKHIFGIKKIWFGKQSIQISDIHRTLIDVLNDPSTGGGGRALIDIAKTYAEKKEANPEILWQYSQQLDSGVVFKRLGLIAEDILKMQEPYLEKIRARCKTGTVLLDPRGPNSGPIRTHWKLRINIPLKDLK